MPAYDAFISYSHAKDKPVAAALQSVIQKLGKAWYERRSLRVFRDDTSLSATPQLWPSIEKALGQSRYLILLASPEAATSPWIGKEVVYWLEHKSPETLFIGLTGGALEWHNRKGDFKWSSGTPLPKALQGRFASEPRWVDLSAYRDGADPRNAKFIELGADFAAAIHGTPKEDLLSEEVRQQRRARRLAVAAAASLLVLTLGAVGAAGIAAWQWQVADAQRDRAEAETARAEAELRKGLSLESDRIAALAHQKIDEGKSALPVGLALQVAPRLKSTEDRPLTQWVVAALMRYFRSSREIERRVLDGNVFRVVVTRDGQHVVTGLHDGNIQFWDGDLTLRKSVKAQEDIVSSLDISPDQKSVLVAGGFVPSVWDLATTEKLFDLAVPNPVKFVKMARFSPDGRIIATGGGDNRVLLFDAMDGSLLRSISGPWFKAAYRSAQRRAGLQNARFGVADPLSTAVAEANFKIFGATTDIAFSPDSKLLAVTGVSDPLGAVRLYDVETGRQTAIAIGTETSLMGGVMWYGNLIQFDVTGKRLAAAASHQNIHIFDTKSGKLERVLPATATSTILMDQEGDALLAGHDDGSITLWCLQEKIGRLRATLRAHTAAVESLTFNLSNTQFASTSSDGTAAVWAMPPLRDVCPERDHERAEADIRLRAIRPVAALEGDGIITHRAVFTHGDKAVLTASRDGSLRKWSINERGTTQLEQLAVGIKGDARPRLTIAGEGTDLIFGAGIWSLQTGRLVSQLTEEGYSAGVSARRSDEKIGFHKSPFETILVDPKDGSSANESDDRPSVWPPYDPDWQISPDGSRAAGSHKWLDYFTELTAKRRGLPYADGGNNEDADSRSERPPVLIDTESGAVLAELAVDNHIAAAPAFSSDGGIVVSRMVKAEERYHSGKESFLAVWNAKSGKLIGRSEALSGELSIDISVDGRRILVCFLSRRDNSTPLLFEIAENHLRSIPLSVAGGSISNAALSTDGRFLAFALRDGSVEILDTEEDNIRTLAATQIPARQIAVSADAEFVATADDSNTVWIIDSSSGAPIASPVMPSPITEMRFALQDRRLVVATQRDGVFLVDVDPMPDLDEAALLDWIRASQPATVEVSEQRKYRLSAAPPLERGDLRLIEPTAPQLKSASMRPGKALALGPSPAEGDEAAAVRNALVMEMAAGKNRVSWAALAIGRRIDDAAEGDDGELKRALFFYELGLWLADNVQQPSNPTASEIALQEKVRARVRQLVRGLPPQEVVAIYRAARDWRVEGRMGSRREP